MEKLSQVLWRERELLDALLYKLEVEQLVMATGRTRWLLRAAQDVQRLIDVLKETEMLRAVVSDEVAASLGVPANPSLQALIDAAPEPWASILSDHRDAFLRITADLTATADANRELITAGIRSARETLLNLTEGTDGYSADGSAVTGLTRTPLLDQSL
ncbi:flagellar protein FlgN [Nocardioides yefusunii]|uniref:flagellar protein FlgN n=1 Tax=Nocardioides yefusunii TaxID=2500546 RepID=UPI000FE421D6|nr:flagellar protein FlgN [Nocardioides yefusunii]